MKTNMLRDRPSWWDSDKTNIKESFPKTRQDIAYEEHSGIKVKKKSKLVKSDNTVIKELSNLLIRKDEVIDDLEVAISKLENTKQRLELQEKTLRNEYNRIYAENATLKDILNQLDTEKLKEKKSKSNELFLTEDAPQEIVDLVWKTLSKTYHPDCGGTEEHMKAINLTRDEFYKSRGWK